MIDSDDDDTPSTQVPSDAEVAEHYHRYRRGTPVARLEGSLITVPEERFESLERQVEQLTAKSKVMGRLMWLAIPGLIGALVTVLLFAADKIAASSRTAGEVETEIRNLREQNAQQREDLKELRGIMHKLGIVDPKAVSIARQP